MGTLHHVAAALARCARACRDGRATVTPTIARRVAASERCLGDEFPRFQRHQRPTGRVA
jgi:hypothetical protein